MKVSEVKLKLFNKAKELLDFNKKAALASAFVILGFLLVPYIIGRILPGVNDISFIGYWITGIFFIIICIVVIFILYYVYIQLYKYFCKRFK
jgi:hypothetical protein